MIQEQYAEQIDNTIYDYCNYMDGLDSEKIIVQVMNHNRSSTAEIKEGEFQKELNFDCFVGHPDYIDDEENILFELKSTSKTKPFILSDDTIKVYIRQITYYMILNDMEKGRIFARYMLPFFPKKVGEMIPDENFPDIKVPVYVLEWHKDTSQFPFFSCELSIPMDAESRERVKRALVEIVKPIYLNGDIQQVPVLDDKPNNWKCNNLCKCKEICDTIPDLQDDPVKRYVLLNKHIDEAVNKKRRYGKRQDKNVVIE